MSPRPRQTIVLAAGNGSRMTDRPGDRPKALVEVAGRPLLEHVLRQAEAVGCREAVVVVGEAGDRIRAALERLETSLRLQTVDNPDHDRPNGLSVLAAEPQADERFFLQMADHVFAEPVLERLLEPESGDPRVRLLVDRVGRYQDPDDATFVRLRERRIVAIGKGLEEADAIDTGCFLGDRRIFEALREAARVEPPTLSAGMRRLTAAGRLEAVELTGVDWVDVDTPAERRLAEEILGERRPATVRVSARPAVR